MSKQITYNTALNSQMLQVFFFKFMEAFQWNVWVGNLL